MANVIQPKTSYRTNVSPKGKTFLTWLQALFANTVGSKYLVALTGAALVIWVTGHLIGNLKIYAGQESINAYAKFLKDLGPLLWIERGILLGIFVLHLALAIRLKQRSRAARPVRYAYEDTVQASLQSRIMLTTGLVVLAFVIFHLAHYTLGVVKGVDLTNPSTGETVNVNYLDLKDSQGRHDVYSMVVYGFKVPAISILYIVAQLFLLLHLTHGIKSVFQTLGLNTRRMERSYVYLAWGIALFLFIGNVSIPVTILAGGIEANPDLAQTLAAAGTGGY